MTELTIEYHIQKKLSPNEQEVALEFVRFLKENHLSFFKDNGAYWKDKVYYWVKQEDSCICYIAIKNPDEENNHWTVWSEDMGSEWLKTDTEEVKVKEAAWRYVANAVLAVVEDTKLFLEKSFLMFVDVHSELIIRRMMTCCL